MSPVGVAPRLSRRRALVLLGAAVPALAACSTSAADAGPDPLIPLAERARTDVALVTAAITADPGLTGVLDPLRSARVDHADALQKEIDRLAGATTPTAAPQAAAPSGAADMAAVRQAVDAAAREATGLIGGLPVERVGLVGSVAACCSAYATVLGSPA
ncbi:hypothetical protein [Pseudonocardia xishanensis]|uniref:Uncharacterized protein n=1 Tax=Pseudonocardia xishanensis TaxID=630995 RepID=A0ABP8RXH2_9PSEU